MERCRSDEFSLEALGSITPLVLSKLSQGTIILVIMSHIALPILWLTKQATLLWLVALISITPIVVARGEGAGCIPAFRFERLLSVVVFSYFRNQCGLNCDAVTCRVQSWMNHDSWGNCFELLPHHKIGRRSVHICECVWVCGCECVWVWV